MLGVRPTNNKTSLALENATKYKRVKSSKARSLEFLSLMESELYCLILSCIIEDESAFLGNLK